MLIALRFCNNVCLYQVDEENKSTQNGRCLLECYKTPQKNLQLTDRTHSYFYETFSTYLNEFKSLPDLPFAIPSEILNLILQPINGKATTNDLTVPSFKI